MLSSVEEFENIIRDIVSDRTVAAESLGYRSKDLTVSFRVADLIGVVPEVSVKRIVMNAIDGEGPLASLRRTEHNGDWRICGYTISRGGETKLEPKKGGELDDGFRPVAKDRLMDDVVRLTLHVVDLKNAPPVDYDMNGAPSDVAEPDMDTAEAVVRYGLSVFPVSTARTLDEVAIDLKPKTYNGPWGAKVAVQEVSTLLNQQKVTVSRVAITGVKRIGSKMIVSVTDANLN